MQTITGDIEDEMMIQENMAQNLLRKPITPTFNVENQNSASPYTRELKQLTAVARTSYVKVRVDGQGEQVVEQTRTKIPATLVALVYA